MKKLILSLVAIATISLTSFGQVPEGFKYQAVVRDAGNLILNNQAVGVQLTIQQGSIGGTAIYTETFTPTTNGYGLVNLEIGTGSTADDFSMIDWSAGPYFIETAVDVTGGTSYAVMGTSQLMSVPYALHAKIAESSLIDLVDDADADPTNEMNTGLALNGTAIEVTDGNGTLSQDLDGTFTTDAELAAWNINDADSDPANEIQDISLTSDILSISGSAGTVDLSPYAVDLVDDADNDPLNEIELQPFGTEGQVLTMVSGVPTWVTPSCGLSIGNFHQGGIIFYLDGTGCHGLVAAATNQSTVAEWGCYGTLIAGADGTAMGAGNQNTIDIEAGCATPGTAADICANLALAGYTDWFLPSKDELNLMYQNIGQGNALGLGNVGGFANINYWSSTEYDVWGSWFQIFGGGTQNVFSKSTNYYVRSVRAF